MTNPLPEDAARRLERPLRLTLAGVLAEHVAQAFWPFATVVMFAAALLLSGALALWPAWLGQVLLAALGLAGIVSLAFGIRRFQPVTRAEALARLDASLPGNPISALHDQQAIGADDPASVALWQAHRARMARELGALRPLPPTPRLARRDPFALRLAAATALATALLFGAGTERGDLAALLPGRADAAIAKASWEGWIEPPAYTGRPTLYLADQPAGPLEVPAGARLTLRFYGKSGAIGLEQSIGADTAPVTATSRSFEIMKNGDLSIGADRWQIALIPDHAPTVEPAGELTRTLDGEMRLPFKARDDYAVTAGQAQIALDPARVDRRFGLAPDPEARDPITVDLPMPYRGDRREVTELLVENLAQHPWAGLPVIVTFRVEDGAGQQGASAPVEITLPGRRFLDPLAAAIIEQRRDILWSAANAARAARLLRAISNRPEGLFADMRQFQALRAAAEALEKPALSTKARDNVAAELWDIATAIEDGALADALERLRRAEARLSQAMRQGATPQELRELMDEYRQAMRDYMRALGKEKAQNRADEPDKGQNQMEMTPDDLQAMMDRIQELMDQGRMQEAQALLDQLQQMMENAQISESASGEGSGGEQAMDDLADTLRRQQELSDQAFRDLQRQRAPGAAPEPGDETQPGDTGKKRGMDGAAETGPQMDGEQNGGGDLAERQRELGQGLAQQRRTLPGAGTPEGDAAREALDQAGRAMDEAADALTQGNTPGALDKQAEAMENLREGMRNLRDGLQREAQAGREGETGRLAGQPGERRGADPLGRTPGGSGSSASNSPLADREAAQRRTRELTEELRRRSGEKDRPQKEREYFERLLEQF